HTLFTETAASALYPLSLHDALPICGPSWRHQDGSEVSGKAVARVESPDADSIPWLLVSATGHAGRGVLAGVTSIQRINTLGGQRSEEHTSELQSRGHLVCRLLLEKK